MYTFNYQSTIKTYYAISTGTSCRYVTNTYKDIYAANTESAGAFVEFPSSCKEASLIVDTYAFQNRLLLKSESNSSDFIGRKTGKNLWNQLIKDYENLKDKVTSIENSDDNLNDRLNEDSAARKLDVSSNALNFANATATTFYTCNKENKEECDEVLDNIFINNEEIADMVGDKKIYMDFFIAIITGIALIIYFVILSVTVIIRNLKLVLLQMMSPIAFICGLDPKDKIRKQWFSMYFATYAELFMYLFAIKLVLVLLDNKVLTQNDSTIQQLFIIMALLLFSKAIPSLLSKLFGLDLSGGTFKDTANMIKRGTMMGAAGSLALGKGVGYLGQNTISAFRNTDGTFKQKLGQAALAGGMSLSTALGGTIRGLGSGYSGKLTGGSKYVTDIGKRRVANYRNGISPSALLSSELLGPYGYDYASRVDKNLNALQQEQERLSDVNKVKSEISNIASGSDFGTYVDNLARNGVLDPSQAKDWKDKWVDAQIASYNGDNSYYEQLKNEIENDSIIGGYKGSIVEKGKQAQIRQQITDLNNMISGDKTISNVVGTDKVTYYARIDEDEKGKNKYRIVKDVDTKANSRKEEIFNKISEKTQTSAYRTSAAIKNSNNDQGGNV